MTCKIDEETLGMKLFNSFPCNQGKGYDAEKTIKSDSCIFCNKPLISGQDVVITGKLQRFDGIPTLTPAHKWYHTQCYELMLCDCLQEDGWKAPDEKCRPLSR